MIKLATSPGCDPEHLSGKSGSSVECFLPLRHRVCRPYLHGDHFPRTSRSMLEALLCCCATGCTSYKPKEPDKSFSFRHFPIDQRLKSGMSGGLSSCIELQCQPGSGWLIRLDIRLDVPQDFYAIRCISSCRSTGKWRLITVVQTFCVHTACTLESQPHV